MLASSLVSAALHVAVLTLLFFAFRAILTPTGSRETVSETTAISIERAAPQPRKPKRTLRPHHHETVAAVQQPAHHELARESPEAPPQPPKQRSKPETSALSHDRQAFADEVAQLNKGNDPHAIPTIDPSSAQPASKSYSFDAHSTEGSDNGNGIIYPVKSWHDGGQDCYYARYTYTYASGAMEDGNIAWPVCFDPAHDPFHLPPHPMPFPLPIAGYVLPPGTELPPLEKLVYDQWAASNTSR
jgi:hypothetical protein